MCLRPDDFRPGLRVPPACVWGLWGVGFFRRVPPVMFEMRDEEFMSACIKLSKECPQCGGTGQLQGVATRGPVSHNLAVFGPCPDCIQGWLPDDVRSFSRGDACHSCGTTNPPIVVLVGTWQDRYMPEWWCGDCVAAARFQFRGD